jgi:hypothetical protein
MHSAMPTITQQASGPARDKVQAHQVMRLFSVLPNIKSFTKMCNVMMTCSFNP